MELGNHIRAALRRPHEPDAPRQGPQHEIHQKNLVIFASLQPTFLRYGAYCGKCGRGREGKQTGEMKSQVEEEGFDVVFSMSRSNVLDEKFREQVALGGPAREPIPLVSFPGVVGHNADGTLGDITPLCTLCDTGHISRGFR